MGTSILLFLAASFFFLVGWAQNATVLVDIGVILDLGSTLGKSSRISISMAIDDFYAAHRNYTTKVVLYFRDSEHDVIEAASAAVDLIKNVGVQAIIGPQTSSQAEIVADLGNKSHIPILSFSATSPSLSFVRTPYFIRTTLNDTFQVGAIAAIVQYFGWREVALIYEDSDYGTGVIPYLIDALQGKDARVPYRSVFPSLSNDEGITQELYKLMTMSTRVFVVHMSPPLGSRLFLKAKEVGMMSKGYAWIITDGIANALDLLDPATINSMQGVIGVRPNVKEMTARFRARFRRHDPDDNSTEGIDPTVFQTWAYDTAWAVATAVEKVNASSPNFTYRRRGNNATELARLGVSLAGARLREELLKTTFPGLSGEFQLVDGQLQSSAFRIVNVIGKGEREIGFWTPASGITQSLNPDIGTILKSVVWPGDATEWPKGWQIPTMSEKKLQIAVPVKSGFNQFVNVEHDLTTNKTSVTGYCIDVFDAVMKKLPYSVPYEYFPYKNSPVTYDELVSQVYYKTCDVVVGDTTIVANRSKYVDFTMPYTESGVSMVVPVEDQDKRDTWIFLRPLSINLWLGCLGFFIYTGFVVWMIEHDSNRDFQGKWYQQLGIVFYFFTFSYKEKLESNLSRLVVVVWVFVMLILTSSYTASLTSLLTVQQLQPTVTDVNVLLKNGDYIGYQEGSFVRELLKRMKVDEHKLKNYSSPDQYAEALSKGSANGGVAAIFDEIPFLRLFLSNHCTGYTMVGPTYKAVGFGFVFPKGSPLVPDVSRAILNLTEGEEMVDIERKWFGNLTDCSDRSNTVSSTTLGFQSFLGLFIITGSVSFLALVIFFVRQKCGLRKPRASETFVGRNVGVFSGTHDNDGKDLVVNLADLNPNGQAGGPGITSWSSGSVPNEFGMNLGSPEGDKWPLYRRTVN